MQRPLVLLVISWTLLLVLFLISGTHRSVSFNLFMVQSSSTVQDAKVAPEPIDRLLGGLLTDGFDEVSCRSRYQSAQYRKVSSHKPSPYLVEQLRRYESLHKKCGPNTELYNKAIGQLKQNISSGPMECNYVVWIAEGGLGNRLLSLVSTFLYAFLSEKVLLLRFPDDLQDMFCEPFPNTTWILPSNFPVKNYEHFNTSTPQSYGNMIRNKVHVLDKSTDIANVSLSAFVYLHLMHDYNQFDKTFFCEDAQELLHRSPWLFLRSNLYFAPSFFLLPKYDNKLSLLFPEKQIVFHHLGRYLLHPTNSVWGGITRYYEAYLRNSKERLGIQVRVFPFELFPLQVKFKQFLNCTLKEGLLPNISLNEFITENTNETRKQIKAVLLTSLKIGYSDRLKAMYDEHPTNTGEIIAVFQPSHEEQQQLDKRDHNVKALSEIYLLSFTDKLVTTAFSTFGYVAQGLAGLKSWIVFQPGTEGPSCIKGMSMEPCFHNPPSFDCKARKKFDPSTVVRHVRRCDDFQYGIKIF